jgi:hypothetical protein
MATETVKLYNRGDGKYVDTKYDDGSQLVKDPMFTPDLDMTQLVTVVTAGTPVQGPDKSNPNGWWLRIDPANTGIISIMFHGQTKATKGFPLDSGQPLIPLNIKNLSSIDFDASVNNQKVWFLKA